MDVWMLLCHEADYENSSDTIEGVYLTLPAALRGMQPALVAAIAEAEQYLARCEQSQRTGRAAKGLAPTGLPDEYLRDHGYFDRWLEGARTDLQRLYSLQDHGPDTDEIEFTNGNLTYTVRRYPVTSL